MTDRVLMYHPKFKVNAAGGKNRPVPFRKGRQQAAWETRGWKIAPSKKTKKKEEAE